MRTKEDILEAIRQTTNENGGTPLGAGKFEKETGIKPYEWGKYWARFGDAQKDAGFVPNKLQTAYTDEFLIEKMIGLIRKLEKFPTGREIQVQKNFDTELPDRRAFFRSKTKEQLASKVMEYCKDRSGYDDVAALCEPVLKKSNEKSSNEADTMVGEVYLIKSGRYYKIGKTNNTVRRGNELRIQLPEKLDLLHSIKTDDPNGIESYWHKRFEGKRMQGEWFDLSAADVKAFKRWRRIT
jgi:hypothetical protein